MQNNENFMEWCFDIQYLIYNENKLFSEHWLNLMNYKELDFIKEATDFKSVLSDAKNEVEV